MAGTKKLVLGMCGLGLIVVGALAVGAPGIRARPVSVAVVDVQKVFDSLAEKVQVDADLQTRAEKLRQEDQERTRRIEDLQRDLNTLAAPGTSAFVQKQEELEQQALELRAWREYQSAKLQRERALQYERLYRKMLDTIGQVAREGGFDLVLFKEAPVDTANLKPEQLGTFIQIRKVLWVTEDLDLTDQVIQKMNNEYRNLTAPKN